MLITARLTVNGTEIPISGFDFQAPPGGLGASLRVQLSRPDTAQVPQDAKCTLEIGIAAGTPPVWSFFPLMKDGRISGRDTFIGWVKPQGTGAGRPADTVEFNALSPLSDRWGLAPSSPIILFDPAKIDKETLTGDDSGLIKDSTGKPIKPAIESIGNLNLRQLLSKAYGLGACGFDRVITNIPNFPIERADFTMEGGYHGGAVGFVSAFEPVYFELNNTLYIIDPARGLPNGFSPRQLPLTCVVSVQNTVETSEIVNAIIVTSRKFTSNSGITVLGYIPSVRFEHDEPQEGGEGDGAYRVEVTRSVTDWKDLTTGAVAYSQETSVETNTFAMRDGSMQAVSTEVIETSYQGKLKTGHTRTVDAVFPDPTNGDGSGNPVDKFGRILEESNRMEWKPDTSNPGESILTRSVTETSGLVLVEEAGEDRKQLTPIQEAQKSGIIVGDGTQSTEFRPMRTVLEYLRESGYNQATINTSIINHLTGQVETPPPVQSRTGSRSTFNPSISRGASGTSVVNRELVTDPDSIAKYGFRRAGTLDIGELDIAEGRLIAARRLKRLVNPRRSASIILPAVDAAIRRGSVVAPPFRSGFDIAFIVLGYLISGRLLGTNDARITQTLTATELG